MAVLQPCRQLLGDQATIALYLPAAVVKSRCEAEPLRSLLQTLTLRSCRGVDVGRLTVISWRGALLQNKSIWCFACFHMWGFHPRSSSIPWDGLGKGSRNLVYQRDGGNKVVLSDRR